MNIACVPKGFVDMNKPVHGLKEFKKSKFEGLVADFTYSNYLLDEQNVDEFAGNMSSFLELCKEKSIQSDIIFVPSFSISSHGEDLVVKYVESCISISGSNGCRYVVVRPPSNKSTMDYIIETKQFYLQFAELAKINNVIILLENQCRSFNGHFIRGEFSDAEETANIIDQLNNEIGMELFGFCFDLGNCNVGGQNPYEYIIAMRNRIKIVIIKDSLGTNKNALLPYSNVNYFEPQTDWKGMVRGLRECEFQGTLIMDFSSTLLATPSFLRADLMRYAYKIADYYRWQIELEYRLKKYKSIILFGAGNMCTQYLNAYGEKYKPLFICDNNSLLWGKKVHDIEIMNPVKLQDTPKESAIVICNIYYDEIEKQINEMGISNEVVRFSDETLDTFLVHEN